MIVLILAQDFNIAFFIRVFLRSSNAYLVLLISQRLTLGMGMRRDELLLYLMTYVIDQY